MQLPATTSEPINKALADHQSLTEDWKFQQLVADLHRWAEIMIVEFKLEIGIPVLMIDPLRKQRLGHYRYGRNGFGLRHEIAKLQLNPRQCCTAAI